MKMHALVLKKDESMPIIGFVITQIFSLTVHILPASF